MPARLPALALMAGLAVLGPAVPAVAEGSYPPGGVRVVAGEVTPERVTPGSSVAFAGKGFAPGSPVRISVDGAQLRTLSADRAGAFRTTLLLALPGQPVLAASGLEAEGRVRVVSATPTVAALAPPASESRGPGLVPALLAGLGLVVAAAGALHVVRRRRFHAG